MHASPSHTRQAEEEEEKELLLLDTPDSSSFSTPGHVTHHRRRGPSGTCATLPSAPSPAPPSQRGRTGSSANSWLGRMRRRGLRCLWGCGARLVRVPTLAEKWGGLTLFGVLVGNPQIAAGLLLLLYAIVLVFWLPLYFLSQLLTPLGVLAALAGACLAIGRY
ncbi:hypothetical protein Naga_100899g3, partial [Nannochloropsis gaditana]